ncbi:MAG: anhydro-N-acetylmuramic acid kinase, partial [Thermomicrobiales bacterium]
MSDESNVIIGLMSGTSVDAIDAALVRIRPTADGQRRHIEVLATAETPFAPPVRQAIFDLFPPNPAPVAAVARLDFLLGEAFATAALALIRAAGLTPEQVDL